MSAKFTLAQAAQIAGTPVTTVRSWFGRGVFGVVADDQAPAFAGDTRLLSPHTVVAVAIVAALTRLNVSPTVAGNAAMTFAHTAQGARYDQKRRPYPGALYREIHAAVSTFMRVPFEGQPEIFPIGPRTAWTEQVTKLGRTGAVILPIDPIIDHAMKGLEFS